MFREVTMVEITEVLRRWLAGTPKKRIAAQLGLDPKTVRRYVEVSARRACGRARPSPRRTCRPCCSPCILPVGGHVGIRGLDASSNARRSSRGCAMASG